MVTLSTAAEAFVRREVASMRAGGQAVWVHRLPVEYSERYGRVSFPYWMAVDDEPGGGFAPTYRGGLEDVVPEGLDDFHLFIGGSDVDEFPSDSGEPPEGACRRMPQPCSRRKTAGPCGSSRASTPQAAGEWLSRPDACLRCETCGGGGETVLVGNPGQECDCGAFFRNEARELVWAEAQTDTGRAVGKSELLAGLFVSVDDRPARSSTAPYSTAQQPSCLAVRWAGSGPVPSRLRRSSRCSCSSQQDGFSYFTVVRQS
jgi:hypothetical protein